LAQVISCSRTVLVVSQSCSRETPVCLVIFCHAEPKEQPEGWSNFGILVFLLAAIILWPLPLVHTFTYLRYSGQRPNICTALGTWEGTI